ncbi:MAG: hypothetical protein B7Z29_02020 [Hyphomicrobium sp. 12-62-95]|nr:MAG: hypothetical protein B7Z29_02020 [Hyphomicrobium sp. 12-62-95]
MNLAGDFEHRRHAGEPVQRVGFVQAVQRVAAGQRLALEPDANPRRQVDQPPATAARAVEVNAMPF